MKREVELKSYLPDFLQVYKELCETLQAQNPEIQELEDLTETIKDNLFISCCDEQGIEKFERMLGLKALDGDTLDNRKFRVLSKWNNAIPYTMQVLHQKLETLCGKDGYELKIIPEQYIVVVRVALKSKRNYEMVRDMLDEVIPANMEIDLSLLFNKHELLGRYTHGQLSSYTYKQIRNEVLEDGKRNTKLRLSKARGRRFL